MKRRAPAVLLAALALTVGGGGLFAYHRYAPRHTPPGQPPLERLDAQTLQRLRARFNEASDKTRLLVLLSPT